MPPPGGRGFSIFEHSNQRLCDGYAAMLNLYQEVSLLRNSKRSTALSGLQQPIDSKFE